MAQVLAFGAVKPTAGTPEALIPAAHQPTVKAGLSSLRVETLPTNTGVVYLLTDDNPADTTDWLNVFSVLVAPGQGLDLTAHAMNEVDITSLYVDVAVSGEGVLASGMVR